MNKRLIFIVLVSLFVLIGISAVSAADEIPDDIASTDMDDVILEENDIQEIVSHESNQELIAACENEKLSESGTSFKDLNYTINGNDNAVVNLEKDYKYSQGDDDFKHGIIINRSLTIDGKGHTLDGSKAARIFNVSTQSKVIFQNISFINGNASGEYSVDERGGSIYALYKGNCSALNCIFTGNYAAHDGGAICNASAYDCIFSDNIADEWGGAICYGDAYNSSFSENYASYGGAIYEGRAYGCSFTENHVPHLGGAIYQGDAYNSSFSENSANLGGAIYESTAYNCSFTGNHADSIGGAIYQGDAYNCSFSENSAGSGGAIYGNMRFYNNAYNCTFSQNYATDIGGAICDCNAHNCSFILNKGGAIDGDIYSGSADEYCRFINPSIIASDITVLQGDKLRLTVTNGSENFRGVAIEMNLSQNGQQLHSFKVLSGDEFGWIANIDPGRYNATLGIIYSQREPTEIVLTVKKGSFWDLNRTINGNDANEITLNTTYAYNQSTDSAFKNGIVIDRPMTIYGNNCTLDGSGVARIFNVTANGQVIFKNISFMNGNATKNSRGSRYGGAIYVDDAQINCTAINCTFTQNKAGDLGGAIYNGNAIDSIFIENYGYYGAGIYGGNAYNCSFINNTGGFGVGLRQGNAYGCNFTGNKASGYGGALYEASAYDCNFINNSANNGGAVSYCYNAVNCNFTDNTANDGGAMAHCFNIVITNCSFIGNNASGYGGAMAQGLNAVITNSSFINNTAYSGDGGAISYCGGTVITNSSFINNTAYSGDGGATCNSGDASYCNFTGNNARDGGAIYFGGSTSYCNFINNTASGNGGARYYGGDLSYCNFTGNNATNGGATYYGSSTSYCNFINNTASADGGARYYGGDLSYCNFTGNNATNGGAICNGTGASYCNFINNTASADGGASYSNTPNNCNFIGNSATNGGALAEISSTVSDCNFTANKASAEGGAVYNVSSLSNCNFTNNTASDKGGAMYNGTANSCTFVGNNATDGGAKYDGDANDCIFINNTAYNKGGAMLYGTASFSNFTSNKAPVGEAMKDATSLFCIFTDNGNENVDFYPTINVTDTTTVYESGEKLLFNLTYNGNYYDGYKATISITKDGESIGTYYGLSGDDGGWIVDLLPGVYNATLTLDPYEAVPVTVTLTVNREETSINATGVTTTYNIGKDMQFTLMDKKGNPIPSATLSVYIDIMRECVTDANGTAVLSISDIGANTYTARISYAGNELYLPSNATALVVIQKAKPSLSAVGVTTTYNKNKNMVITLRDNLGNPIAGAPVIVDINGAKKYISDGKGQVIVSTKGLVPKSYTAKISFENENYTKAEITAKMAIKKAKPKLAAKKKSFKLKTKTKKYAVTLKDNLGRALKSKKLTLKVKGKTYKAKTNKKGKAIFKITKLNKRGKFKAVVKFAGDKCYKKVTKKVKITVKGTLYKTVSKGSKDKATVKKIQKALKKNGYYLTYKGRYLKVDGKYSSCTVRSVKEFQRDKGLKVTGKADYKTAKKLKIVK